MSTSTDRQDRVTATKTAPNFKSAPVPTHCDLPLYEHYNLDGYLLLITSDPDAIDLEPGDFVVKRDWRTSVVPYVHHEMPGPSETDAEDAAPGPPVARVSAYHQPCLSIQCAKCFPSLGEHLSKADSAVRTTNS